MSVRAKFTCTEVDTRVYGKETINAYKFSAVMGGSEENKQFFMWTPSASIDLGTVKGQPFEVGKEYYVDFIEASPQVAPAIGSASELDSVPLPLAATEGGKEKG